MNGKTDFHNAGGSSNLPLFPLTRLHITPTIAVQTRDAPKLVFYVPKQSIWTNTHIHLNAHILPSNSRTIGQGDAFLPDLKNKGTGKASLTCSTAGQQDNSSL